MSQAADDSFELYDLRVEAVVPEGARIFCGAKPGDYFELRGEMLSLPLGQGFSIYSLAALLPLLPVEAEEASTCRLVSCCWRCCCRAGCCVG